MPLLLFSPNKSLYSFFSSFIVWFGWDEFIFCISFFNSSFLAFNFSYLSLNFLVSFCCSSDKSFHDFIFAFSPSNNAWSFSFSSLNFCSNSVNLFFISFVLLFWSFICFFNFSICPLYSLTWLFSFGTFFSLFSFVFLFSLVPLFLSCFVLFLFWSLNCFFNLSIISLSFLICSFNFEIFSLSSSIWIYSFSISSFFSSFSLLLLFPLSFSFWSFALFSFL